MGERIAVVMAGGGGTRLWPASTSDRPKQLIDPLLRSAGGTHRDSLLAQTVARLDGIVAPDDIHVVTTAEQAESIRAALPGLAPERLIVEPWGRNTAPCIALSILHLRATRGPRVDDATLLVLPADHHIGDVQGFRQLLTAACVHAEASRAIVTLGIEPDYPATGFGYLERADEPLPAVQGDEGTPVFMARRFVEKPDLERARSYLRTGRYLWNAGIFVMPVGRIATELARHCPQTWQALAPIGRVLPRDEDRVGRISDQAYTQVRSEPIDVAVMEKLEDLRVVPARVGWTDLGSWRAVYGMVQRDERGNAVITAPGAIATLVDVDDSLVWSEDAEVGVLGVQDLCIVISRGRVLVCPRERAQDVRMLVERLRRS